MKFLLSLVTVCILLSHDILLSQASNQPIVQNTTADTLAVYRIDTLSNYLSKQFYKRNYDKTIEVGEYALALSEKNNYYKKYASISSYLGNSYLELEDSLTAKKIFTQSIGLAVTQKDTIRQIISEIDFANLYALRSEESSKKKAINYYKKIIPLAKKIEDYSTLLTLNSNISELYLDLGNSDLAAIYIQHTEELLKRPKVHEIYVGSVAINTARLLTQKRLYVQALPYFDKSLKIFEKLNYQDGIIEVYKYAIENALERNNYRDAYEAQKMLDVFELEKYKADKIEAVQTVITKFRLDEVKKELLEERLISNLAEEKAKRDTTIFWVKIAGIILVLFLLFVFYSWIKRRRLLSNLLIKNKQYLEQKERSEKLYKVKSKLFSNITHELRTPMYGIIGISNSLMDNEKFAEEKQDLKSLKFSADYLLALVNNILHFNKLETNEIDSLKVVPFDIRTLLFTIVETSKFLSEEHPNTYSIHVDDSIPNILMGDRIKLAQILINLIGNASKFTNDGEIDISLTITEQSSTTITIIFTIQDNGVGVSEEEIDSLFDQYTQTGDRQNFMGTGLGLPIVSKLLEQQNSKLTFESELGKGTSVKFPLSFRIDSNTPIDTSEGNPPKSTLINTTILVVDDNKINQIVTKKFLERYSADCMLAKSGKEAVEITKAQPIDLILMDINMPVMDGFEATRVIRTFNKDIPIIALTAVDKDKVVGEHTFSLMNDIIIKPYANEIFIDTLVRHLKKHRV